MSLQYALFENFLTEAPDDFMARVQNAQRKTEADVIDYMISRGSTVTKATALAVVEEYTSAFEHLVSQGINIYTALCSVTLSIKGVFLTRLDAFDVARHRVSVNMRPGARLRKIAELVQVERVDPSPAMPIVLDFEDVNAGTRNDGLTPGGLGVVRGSRLKYAPNDPQQGIFFVDSADAETRVAVVARNMPKELYFQVPDTLASGAYTLEVRSRISDGGPIRSGLLLHSLTVA